MADQYTALEHLEAARDDLQDLHAENMQHEEYSGSLHMQIENALSQIVTAIIETRRIGQ